MLMIDDYTMMATVSFLKKRSEAFECFKIYKDLVENETDLKIKCLRSDKIGRASCRERVSSPV